MKNLSFAVSLLLAASVIGCGPLGQQFHGTYNATGTASFTFTGVGSQTGPMSASYRISEGAHSDIVISESSGQCALPADVEGDVATLKPGTTCTYVEDGATVTMTVTNGVLSINGTLVQLNLSGNLTVTQEGRTYPGTFVQNATLTRVGK